MDYKVKLQEFLGYGEPSLEIVFKIIEYHLMPINRVRQAMGRAIFIRSGYRSHEHELKMGRIGTSQHCYTGKGATDVSLTANSRLPKNGSQNKLLAKELVNQGFRRICYYPEENFFHVDYHSLELRFFVNSGDKWENVTEQVFYDRATF